LINNVKNIYIIEIEIKQNYKSFFEQIVTNLIFLKFYS
jgi:hypothetical protein